VSVVATPRILPLADTGSWAPIPPLMSKVARGNVAGASFEEAGLLALASSDSSADAVMCSLALAHVGDPEAALAHGLPGARLS